MPDSIPGFSLLSFEPACIQWIHIVSQGSDKCFADRAATATNERSFARALIAEKKGITYFARAIFISQFSVCSCYCRSPLSSSSMILCLLLHIVVFHSLESFRCKFLRYRIFCSRFCMVTILFLFLYQSFFSHFVVFVALLWCGWNENRKRK